MRIPLQRIDTFVRSAVVNTFGQPSMGAAIGITPQRVIYEDLVADPIGTLSGVFALLGRNPARAQISRPGTQRLATETNHDWARQDRNKHGLPSTSLDA